ncbi:TPA: DNA translocase FtsK [Haemophilus influenzae]|uniref:DNA translocase FtsK n=1 Tax=Haemophilus influenzae TaxID=727 RepID=UPI000D01644B|nr:DNA translocase FtsK [Haemophilus influenzae]MCK8804284.1 DNA translocase FtsK 4TM domain-containing protein [Haemophilus influenzae]MCK8896363.1 DNA translocase FtsK 4TM domain-containing protein [Haemophilus influenzae]MCK8971709.1 DNA translocase FtsK 4TM domain-containing protein [Haemophilus influenzae]MCK8985686.1 DNA translocase FtsK 4TM domain-containing protein [Haemophilus influenzae]MCK9075017.1 DNA translocase FtsK 4TM domain-containing protein [Haemophilus influenzae]
MIKQITERFTPRQYLAEFLLGLTALFGLYLIVAWSSYTPLDNSWATASAYGNTINKVGTFGAWIIDLFFVFFGYVAHIIPFTAFLVPIYLLKTKAVKHLSCTRIILRSFGFTMLIIGLCVVSMLLLSSNTFYLSGGVLGGSLVVNWFYPVLGKFGSILIGFVFALIGFIFCSGASLIRLIVAFYYWLTMKNEQSENTEQEKSTEELEQIVIVKSDRSETENLDQNPLNVEQNSEIETVKPSLEAENISIDASSSHLINISGLNPEVSIKSEYELANEDSEKPQFSFGFDSESLPSVNLSSDSDEQRVSKNDFVVVWNKPVKTVVQEDLAINQSADDFTQVSLLTNDEMPTVSLKLTSDTEMADNHFAAQVDEKVDLEKDEVKFSVSLQNNVGVIELDKNQEPNYKGYSGSLIHPAFQQQTTKREKPSTPLPSLDLLLKYPPNEQRITPDEIMETSQRIEQQLRNFNVKASVKDVLVGPVVTRYELELQPGVKASKVTSIDTDLARALMFRSIRVAEVIPGKPYIGIETPNLHRQMVPLRDVLDSNEFRDSKATLPIALGKDISGKPVIVDLAKMPHLLVAGSTGSGKSVGVNTMILSLLYRVQPEDVKFIMIDPKVVELSVYNDIPHLLTPVVTDMKKAANALRWCVDEMERRYQLLSALRVRNIEGFNEKIDEYEAMGMPVPNPIWRPSDTMDAMPPALKKLSYIVVIVDEFADLMMVAGKQIEELIARLAQKARAIGIHLILATQRPSVDVITGLIKANIPSRIAFTVASKIDSRTILDQGGAEALLGRGDMLYSGQGSSDLIRVHGAYMSDDEVINIADDWRARGKPDYIDGILESTDDEESSEKGISSGGELDPLFDEVMDFVINTGTTSVSSIQRKFSVGFNRAARIMDQMEEQGIVSPMQNGKREILSHRPEY